MSYRIDEDGATVQPEYIGGILIWMALLVALLSNLGRADEFRAVVVTDSESAALRAAKTRADEAQAAFAKLREATESRYRERLGGTWSLDWSTDFRVIAERRWLPPSNLQWIDPQWIDPQPLYRPGGWGSVTIPTTLGSLRWPSGELFSSNVVPERGVNAIDWSVRP